MSQNFVDLIIQIKNIWKIQHILFEKVDEIRKQQKFITKNEMHFNIEEQQDFMHEKQKLQKYQMVQIQQKNKLEELFRDQLKELSLQKIDKKELDKQSFDMIRIFQKELLKFEILGSKTSADIQDIEQKISIYSFEYDQLQNQLNILKEVKSALKGDTKDIMKNKIDQQVQLLKKQNKKLKQTNFNNFQYWIHSQIHIQDQQKLFSNLQQEFINYKQQILNDQQFKLDINQIIQIQEQSDYLQKKFDLDQQIVDCQSQYYPQDNYEFNKNIEYQQDFINHIKFDEDNKLNNDNQNDYDEKLNNYNRKDNNYNNQFNDNIQEIDNRQENDNKQDNNNKQDNDGKQDNDKQQDYDYKQDNDNKYYNDDKLNNDNKKFIRKCSKINNQQVQNIQEEWKEFRQKYLKIKQFSIDIDLIIQNKNKLFQKNSEQFMVFLDKNRLNYIHNFEYKVNTETSIIEFDDSQIKPQFAEEDLKLNFTEYLELGEGMVNIIDLLKQSNTTQQHDNLNEKYHIRIIELENFFENLNKLLVELKLSYNGQNNFIKVQLFEKLNESLSKLLLVSKQNQIFFINTYDEEQKFLYHNLKLIKKTVRKEQLNDQQRVLQNIVKIDQQCGKILSQIILTVNQIKIDSQYCKEIKIQMNQFFSTLQQRQKIMKKFAQNIIEIF